LTRRVSIVEPVRANAEALQRALSRRGLTWAEHAAINADTTMVVTSRLEGERLHLTGEHDANVPYFGWVFNGPIRAAARARLRHVARVLEAEAAGAEPPPVPKQPWWSPPEPMTAAQIRTIATISFLLAVVEYGSGLLSQTTDYVGKSFHATDANLGVLLAVTRVGNLIVLVGGLLADRWGRRRLLLASLVITMVATALSGAAPNFSTFGTLQVIVNGASNLAFMIGFIAAVEEAPEGSRTYTLAIVGIASSLGFAAGAILLSFADVRPGAWRVLYALGVLGLLAIPSVARNLAETKRFEALVARDAKRGRIAEVVDQKYGGRFALLCVTGYLLAFHFAPTAQLTNRYLNDERGFSGLGILLLRAATQVVPGLIAAYLGGRMAESMGRRPVARLGLLLAAVFGAVFFTTTGPLLWFGLAVGTAASGWASPSLSSFGSELFPTEIRGTAGAGLTIAAVMGSASGLLVAGFLSQPLGSIGKAIALTGIAPVIVALLLVRHLPEARGRLLDEVSPSEV
jgi:MFS family permease